MADFEKAVAITLRIEGGLVDDSSDPGGLTNFGIALNRHPELTAADIRSMTPARAKAIYRQMYWSPLYDEIVSEGVGEKLFDMGVPNGPGAAVRCLQKALREIQVGPIVADGKFGSSTLAAVNAADETRLLLEFKVQLVLLDFQIVQNNPLEKRFEKGWVRRVLS